MNGNLPQKPKVPGKERALIASAAVLLAGVAASIVYTVLSLIAQVGR